MKITLLFSIAFLLINSSCSKIENDINFQVQKNQQKAQLAVLGTVYYIAQGGITDHSNATTENSIAWYFTTYGPDNTYILNTPNTYYGLGSLLTVPENSIFKGNTGMVGKIAALSTADNKTLIDLSNGSQLKNMYINGVRYASCLVRVNNRNTVTIDSCTIFDSKNNYTSGNPYTMLIYCNASSNVIVQNSILRRAGCTPKVNPTLWSGLGYLILSRNCSNMTFQNNNIGSALTCGIDMTGSSSVQILNNIILDTGLNREYSGSIADAITAYHNWNLEDENFTITGNTITNAGNHGIHVSGKGIDIQNNTISNQQLSGVMVDDWRTTELGNEYSENVIIKNNKCGDPLSWVWQPGNSNRKIYVDRVNNGTGITLDYTTNKDLAGVVLVVNSTNYHLPTLFGIHQ